MRDKEENDIIDILDENGCDTGEARERSEAHTKGLWHRTIQCWIYWVEGRELTLMLQRRSRMKRAWPGFLDASVAGHCKAGESPIETCMRELYEELGIRAKPSELLSQGLRIVDSRGDKLINREFQEVYLLRKDRSIVESLQLNAQEVQAIVPIGLDDLRKLLSGQIDRMALMSSFEIDQQNRLFQRDAREVTLADFIPDQLTFLCKICHSLVAIHSQEA